jgi:hypothetical protein
MATTVPTAGNVVLGEGAFYINYDSSATPPAGTNVLVGATRGGNFVYEPEFKDIEFDGRRGAVKGFKRVIGWNVQLTVNTLEIANSETVTDLYATLQKDDTGTDVKVTAKKQIDDTDYLNNVTFVGENAKGQPVIITVLNALGDGNLELALEDKEEVVPEVQFTGHADPADIATPPFELHFPKVV